MPSEYLRPIVVAVVATAVSLALGRALSRWLPNEVGGKAPSALLREYRSAIWAANGSVLLGLAIALVMYKLWGFATNDWRPLGLGLGFALAAPIIVLHLSALWSSQDSAEALGAYSLHQKLPIAVRYGLACLGVVALAGALTAVAR